MPSPQLAVTNPVSKDAAAIVMGEYTHTRRPAAFSLPSPAQNVDTQVSAGYDGRRRPANGGKSRHNPSR